MAHEGFHEENLPEEVRDYHRMIQSVIEELEAVDWYNQRAAATSDAQVKAIVEHNRDEEIEHACMGLEWLRRAAPAWDENLRTFLFTAGDITAVEEGSENQEDDSKQDQSLGIKGQ
jgi:ferritin-like protein